MIEAQQQGIRLAAEAAAAAFTEAGWKWTSDPGPRVPDADEIEATLLRLVENLRTSDTARVGHSSATGGLYVEWGEEGEAYVTLDVGTIPRVFAPVAASLTKEPSDG